MKKLAVFLLTTLLLFNVLTACSKDKPQGSADGTTYTGVLEEKKDFMVIIASEDGKNSYIFNLDKTTCDANVGDKVTVTYTGDLDDIDSSLVATKIEKSG